MRHDARLQGACAMQMCIRDSVYDVTYGSIERGVDNLVVIDDSIVRGTTIRQSILTILDRLGPVSYTHLDVYKRQIYGHGYMSGLPSCSK